MTNQHLSQRFPPIFALQDAYAIGISRAQIRCRGLQRVYREIYAHRDAVISRQAFLETLSETIEKCPFTSVTAAQLWGMRLPHRHQQDQRIYVMTGTRHQRISRPDIVSTQAKFEKHEVTLRNNLLLTTPERTYLELGKILSPEELVYVADGLLCHHPHRKEQTIPLVYRSNLQEYLETKHRIRGLRKCKWALEQAVEGSDSWKETELRLLLVEYGITGLVANRPLVDTSGRMLAEPDLADEKHRISIQYEGAHHAERQQMVRDRRRRQRTEAAGWVEVRVFAEDLREYEQWEGESVPRVVKMVLSAREEQGG